MTVDLFMAVNLDRNYEMVHAHHFGESAGRDALLSPKSVFSYALKFLLTPDLHDMELSLMGRWAGQRVIVVSEASPDPEHAEVVRNAYEEHNIIGMPLIEQLAKSSLEMARIMVGNFAEGQPFARHEIGMISREMLTMKRRVLRDAIAEHRQPL